MPYSNLQRRQNIEKMKSEVFDLVVIGGGISGAGVARDAAGRGMKVALVEAQDYASGTSSRSSKLVHGGIRYLENLEFGLVFEALRERRNLFEMAPNLVHPLRFILPLYKDSRVGMVKMGLGMWLYDILSTFEAPELHEHHSLDQTLKRVPVLNSRELRGSYVYSDAYMDDDRIVIETLRSAANWGAVTANYVSAKAAEFEDGKVKSVTCRDEISQNEFRLSGRHFVSTVGPWTDQLGHKIFSDWRKIMRPSKGIHLTFRRERLPIRDAVVMVTDDQKRIVFAIPRHEMVIVGTTDTDYSGDPREVHSTREDVEYLLKVADHYFPGAGLQKSDIISSYAGVRPLVDDGAATESKTSREHLIFTDPRNVTFVTGGKYTTYRQIAEDALHAILDVFSLEERIRWGKSRTLEPLNPMVTKDSLFKSQHQTEAWARDFKIDVDTVHFLVERHGAETKVILGKFASRVQSLPPTDWRWYLEAYHAIHETMCLTLRDFYLRRVPLFLSRQDHGFPLLEDLSKIFQSELQWSDDDRAQQVEIVKSHLRFEMGWLNS